MGYYSFFVFLRQRYKQIKDPPTDYIYDAIYKIYIHKYTYTKKPHNNVAGLFLCWTTRIRTWTNRTKTCCATITP